MNRAAVLGTGLIGTSVALALTEGGWTVTGWDPNPEHLAVAGSRRALLPARSPADAIEGVDLVVLAGPPQAIVAQLADLTTEALVTDVAGVKTPVVEAARHLPRFVGGHPMAGRESTGPGLATSSLFKGASWVLTIDRTSAAALSAVSEIVASLGATPIPMTAADHDADVALISHLPHVLASALVRKVAAHPEALELAAGGFRDLTRIALSEPSWWADVLVANRTEVASSLRDMATELAAWAVRIEQDDSPAVAAALQGAREVRRSLAPPVAAVIVVLDDRPGEVARVGHALAASRVDLRDLQLRHATHGGGGILTLSVRFEEEAALRQALISDGFRLGD